MSEAEFMEDGLDYYNIDNENDENAKCTRQSCDGCLCTNWCLFYKEI